MISGVADVKEAVEVIKLGARDLLEKPLNLQAVMAAVDAAVRRWSLHSERDTLLNEILTGYEIIGSSGKMQEAKDKILQYSRLSESVLVTGESGTGKKLVAANLHYLSFRRQQRYSKINIASLPENLIEAQLFGHIKGAYSGADKASPVLFQSSFGSTLFLDEIGELKYELQPKLLRAIQEKEILPVGSTQVVAVDVRWFLQQTEILRKRSPSEHSGRTSTTEYPP